MRRTRNPTATPEELVDRALIDSFPASDLPFFMAAAAVLGAPRRDPKPRRGTNKANRPTRKPEVA